jgi:hypothetical protein
MLDQSTGEWEKSPTQQLQVLGSAMGSGSLELVAEEAGDKGVLPVSYHHRSLQMDQPLMTNGQKICQNEQHVR